MSTAPVSIPKILGPVKYRKSAACADLYDQQEEKKSKPKKLPFGCLKGKLTMTEDFDEPLPEFEEYQ